MSGAMGSSNRNRLALGFNEDIPPATTRRDFDSDNSTRRIYFYRSYSLLLLLLVAQAFWCRFPTFRWCMFGHDAREVQRDCAVAQMMHAYASGSYHQKSLN
jgi:hypothetical protein